MKHYPDIESWPDEKLSVKLSIIFEDGYETEQEPEQNRSEWTKNYLKVLYEKHAECIEETNRRVKLNATTSKTSSQS